MPARRRKDDEPQLDLGDEAMSPDHAAGGSAAAGPLAARMRPRSLDEFVGQPHLREPGSVLRGLIEEDRLRSVILWGPAGTGKTTLAQLIAGRTKAAFVTLSAVTAGVADVRRVVEEGRARLATTARRTVLFIDEVHRFSRTQQDALLPGVEDGAVVFIGATTENPYASVTSPLLSRSLLFRLERLGPDDLRAILERALDDPERGLGGHMEAAPGALDLLVDRAEGDARIALNALEAAADRAAARGARELEEQDAAEAMRDRFLRYDRAGDQHYDAISAYIKSMRGSDPDAALAWLVRMIEGGEDPRFVARRLVIFASEDVGMADPQALAVAVAAAHAVDLVGLPEAEINLAHATVYCALASKSNAVIRALGAAKEDLRERGQGEVPTHLRGQGPGAGALGHGAGYKYPHDFPRGRVEQEYLPEGLEGRKYWVPEPDPPADGEGSE